MHAHAPRCDVSCALRARSNPRRTGWSNFLPGRRTAADLKAGIVKRFRNKAPDKLIGLQPIIAGKLKAIFGARDTDTARGCVPPPSAMAPPSDLTSLPMQPGYMSDGLPAAHGRSLRRLLMGILEVGPLSRWDASAHPPPPAAPAPPPRICTCCTAVRRDTRTRHMISGRSAESSAH